MREFPGGVEKRQKRKILVRIAGNLGTEGEVVSGPVLRVSVTSEVQVRRLCDEILPQSWTHKLLLHPSLSLLIFTYYPTM